MSILNNSPSKQKFSFSTASRFPKVRKSYCDQVSYTLKPMMNSRRFLKLLYRFFNSGLSFWILHFHDQRIFKFGIRHIFIGTTSFGIGNRFKQAKKDRKPTPGSYQNIFLDQGKKGPSFGISWSHYEKWYCLFAY